jgi:hypothetical protein
MTSVFCGQYCKNNCGGICAAEIAKIDEDKTCRTFEYDITKAECPNCAYYIDGICDIDCKEKTEDSTCTNSQYTPV